jgi:undecaprenyl diphosphate synthase
LPRTAGHAAGARAVTRVVEAAARGVVDTLTLYAFSSDNWLRPAGEVRRLMLLLKRYLASETERCVENGVRVTFIGRRDRLDPDLCASMERTECSTIGGSRLNLRLAVDYSSRDAIVRAALEAPFETADRHAFAKRLAVCDNISADALDVDLLIRTGGERRLSDFLLWECAYAELVFVDTCWPDFDEQTFEDCLLEFQRRQRRFGTLSQVPSAQAAGEAR